MADEPTLPRLPAVAWNSETESFSNTRKRARDTANPPPPPPPQFSTSSDPAVFSSDDDPHIDNYIQGRHRKKRYVGSWYQQHPASSDSTFSEEVRPLPKKAQRTFQRQFDSGVWMGSDGFTEDEDTIMEPEFSGEPRLPQLSHVRAKVALSQAEEFARRKIQEAIDTGNEVIDLSGLDLEGLSSETISQLSEFSCIPLVAEDVPFEQRDPALKLYLAQNPLPRAPGAIFNLEFLTVLSLRNTHITELPPSIGNLRNLTDLNLSLNRLQYLPGELLDLLQYPGKLLNLSLHPNPFYAMKNPPNPPLHQLQPSEILFEDFPETGAKTIYEQVWPNGDTFRVWFSKEDRPNLDDIEPSQIQHLDCRRWQILAIGRSPVQYSDSRGTILSKFQLPVRELTDSPEAASEQPSHVSIETEDLGSRPDYRCSNTAIATTTSSSSSSSSSGRVPSLFESALKACARSGRLHELPSYLPAHAPPPIPRALARLAAQGEDNASGGDVPCGVCGRRVMMPTTAWVEWWDVSRTVALPGSSTALGDPVSRTGRERSLPFLRRGCCWAACVPTPLVPGQLRPGSVRWSRIRPAGVDVDEDEDEDEDGGDGDGDA